MLASTLSRNTVNLHKGLPIGFKWLQYILIAI